MNLSNCIIPSTYLLHKANTKTHHTQTPTQGTSMTYVCTYRYTTSMKMNKHTCTCVLTKNTYVHVQECTVRLHLSAPHISSSLIFRSSLYWNKSTIILLYTILLLPYLSSSLAISAISSRTNVCMRSDCMHTQYMCDECCLTVYTHNTCVMSVV